MVFTHEGYVLPLHIHDGLFYRDMVPATDNDFSHFLSFSLLLIHPGTPLLPMNNFSLTLPCTSLTIPIFRAIVTL